MSYKNTLRQKLETVFAEMATELPDKHTQVSERIFDDLGLRVTRKVNQKDDDGNDILGDDDKPLKTQEPVKTNTQKQQNKALARWLSDKVRKTELAGFKKKKEKQVMAEIKAEEDTE